VSSIAKAIEKNDKSTWVKVSKNANGIFGGRPRGGKASQCFRKGAWGEGEKWSLDCENQTLIEGGVFGSRGIKSGTSRVHLKGRAGKRKERGPKIGAALAADNSSRLYSNTQGGGRWGQ